MILGLPRRARLALVLLAVAAAISLVAGARPAHAEPASTSAGLVYTYDGHAQPSPRAASLVLTTGTTDTRDGVVAPLVYSYDGRGKVSKPTRFASLAASSASRAMMQPASEDRGRLTQAVASGFAAEEVAPQAAQDALQGIDEGKWPPPGNPGMKGGSLWRNLGDPLPTTDGDGNPITYKEWDVNPPGPTGRDSIRIITGSDGSAWYTDDHYGTFTRIR